MPNSIEYATIFQQELDKAFVPASTTGWMQRNARLAKYTGGAEIQIPSLLMDGLADYDRGEGFAQGDVTLTYTTVTMSRDRGRGFNLDAMAVDESNFVATASNVMGEFQRTKVIPEVDAYNLSTLYAKTPVENQEAVTLAANTVSHCRGAGDCGRWRAAADSSDHHGQGHAGKKHRVQPYRKPDGAERRQPQNYREGPGQQPAHSYPERADENGLYLLQGRGEFGRHG